MTIYRVVVHQVRPNRRGSLVGSPAKSKEKRTQRMNRNPEHFILPLLCIPGMTLFTTIPFISSGETLYIGKIVSKSIF
jgi:hypothetical protein